MNTLYRHFDAANVLLYVGVTKDIETRNSQHRVNAPWWRQVVRTTEETFESRSEALTAELVAIATERPVHNVAESVERDALGSVLRREIATAGMSMRDASRAAGIPLATLHRRCTVGRKVKVSELVKLAAVLNKRPSDLVLTAETIEASA